MILVIDNYDSFTFNLVHYLRGLGIETRIERNDAVAAGDVLESGASGIILSPGPGRPEQAGISLELVAACAEARLPMLGICLGHQVIAQHFGAAIVPSPRVTHGKTSVIRHDGSNLFAGLPSPFIATRYHSLCVRPDTLPTGLNVSARAEDGTIQALSHESLPLHGVQFHPESIASEHGHAMLRNFLNLTEPGAAMLRPRSPSAA
jgi:anthranilate synthase component 2